MKRRSFFSIAAAASVPPAFLASNSEAKRTSTTPGMRAGFARVRITPPLGTAMTGFGARDYDPAGCKGIHDDLYINALYICQGEEQALIMGFDLCFFSRDEADRFKGAIGRKMDVSPGQILLNTSHNHTGPKVGTWFYTPSDRFYLRFVEDSIVKAALDARDSAREVTIRAGAAKTEIPMSRRKKLPDGSIEFAPYPEGAVYKKLPICVFTDTAGEPVCLLFSVSCHPATIKGVEQSYWISADFPGAAMAYLDDNLGADVSCFLQGVGGDSNPNDIIKGLDPMYAGTWEHIDRMGKIIADEVIEAIGKGLVHVEPELRVGLVDMEWPLVKSFTRSELEEIVKNPTAHPESMPEVRRMWARELIAKMNRGYEIPTSVSISAHGIQLGRGLRLVGIEGELVAELGTLIEDFYGGGITFPMGYTDGTQMYLPTTSMLDEGGYEVESYWEYRQPSGLAGGHEKILLQTLQKLRSYGID